MRKAERDARLRELRAARRKAKSRYDVATTPEAQQEALDEVRRCDARIRAVAPSKSGGAGKR